MKDTLHVGCLIGGRISSGWASNDDNEEDQHGVNKQFSVHCRRESYGVSRGECCVCVPLSCCAAMVESIDEEHYGSHLGQKSCGL